MVRRLATEPISVPFGSSGQVFFTLGCKPGKRTSRSGLSGQEDPEEACGGWIGWVMGSELELGLGKRTGDLQTVVMEANDLGGKSSIRSQLGEYQL